MNTTTHFIFRYLVSFSICITVSSEEIWAAARKTNSPSSFIEFCQSAKVTPEQEISLEQLKKIVPASDCADLERKINKDRFIIDNDAAENCKIGNLDFLRYFPNLEQLRLDCHPVKDLSALALLPNLQTLILDSPHIQNITPLSQLKNLNFVNLSQADIKDYSALKDLRKLDKVFVKNGTLSACHRDPKKMSPFCKKQLQLDSHPYENRYRLVGVSKTMIALQHFYSVSECCGGREGIDCAYPGLRLQAEKAQAPYGGLSLVFLALQNNRVTSITDRLKSFSIYKASFEKERCSQGKESQIHLVQAKKFSEKQKLKLSPKPLSTERVKPPKEDFQVGASIWQLRKRHSEAGLQVDLERLTGRSNAKKHFSFFHASPQNSRSQLQISEVELFSQDQFNLMIIHVREDRGIAGVLDHPYFITL